MQNLLENQLVRKYFACESFGGHKLCTKQGYCKQYMAYRIIQAMQEPIKSGEKMLELYHDGRVVEEISVGNHNQFHSWFLRLPSQFQPPKKEMECLILGHMCDNCGGEIWEHKKSPSPSKAEFECKHNYGAVGVGCMPWCKDRSAPQDDICMEHTCCTYQSICCVCKKRKK